MHLIYRSKKQTLPVVSYNKAPLLHPSGVPQHHSTVEMFRKKSIDIVFDKHLYALNMNETALIYNPPQRKTFYRRNKSKKQESGYIKSSTLYEQPNAMVRNKSTQITEREASIRRRSDYAPYVLSHKKSRSTSKFKIEVAKDQQQQKVWICEQLIQNQIYCMEEGSDFN